ncbi:uncharacterized protein LOC127449060 [Myxocyprinus asiaticus]|uniref:uncharacterized protein LOC127449060 n=1 Tax=Myxocyprinus asiaticus TaxID=70543 RepID=UPI002222A0DD|nr:uncharacterized protein LOC127449060 [Myxocyprinus asiaticus]XP_051568136.1 uncharacterized protein LOC127449060 [Myxocyprinus asiaticus]XP_051568137.1 uncharacterized protein LOC127449060 [Myxocyprinus asiaticus]XP_051568138.1 uncharacterized protein LOC127449060 [Myxocyprinus asiaticus]XP_051568139.1 uncharacterized protein LOC127449060 [Myxocyprinus asiaticus]XP_051568140.1 uncharacterized protein LOC127449060 [Myxocyprinus asiaticus]XP_051568142.1 uncharacterized protein LOC127449060 [
MAEGRWKEDLVTPHIGRVRGFFGVNEPIVGRSRMLVYDSVTVPTTLHNNEPSKPESSTPANAGCDNVSQQLRNLIGELGSQIGDSIATWLLTNQTSALLGSASSSEQQPSRTMPLSQSLDLSKLNLVVKADIKELQMFRGDGSDKCTILEWIEQMEMYLSKKGCDKFDSVEEVLNHLCSRAKSIVRVKLKSSPATVLCPEVVYEVLRRYVSESPGSCQPLADFYAMQPKPNEHPVDYWIRLKEAAELADAHLQRCGGKMENMSSEIAMMFIRNCPNPDLSTVFRCKPVSKWSAEEVQEAIDEHERDFKSWKLVPSAPKVAVNQAIVAEKPVSTQVAVGSESMGVTSVVCTVGPHPRTSEAAGLGTLEHVLKMLERVLEHTTVPASEPKPRTSSWYRASPCEVCGDRSHSIRSHCMREKRCLHCLEFQHQRKQCHRVVGQGRAQTSDNRGN